MNNTYSQIYVHVVFAVEDRDNLLDESWRYEIFKYMAGIVKNKGQKTIIINGMGDHVHLFLGIKPTICLSDLIRDVKCNSSSYIKRRNLVHGNFKWQTGFGAFSYGQSQIEKVYEYIKNQELHHKEKSFKDEYLQILKKFEIEYNEKYLFNWID